MIDKIKSVLYRVLFVLWVVMQSLLAYDCFKQLYQYLNENTVVGLTKFLIIGEIVLMSFFNIVFIVGTAYLIYREVQDYILYRTRKHKEKKNKDQKAVRND